FHCLSFQAEDGIRDFHVTGVQTCALPICSSFSPGGRTSGMVNRTFVTAVCSTPESFFFPSEMLPRKTPIPSDDPERSVAVRPTRSEERRVGKRERISRAQGLNKDVCDN